MSNPPRQRTSVEEILTALRNIVQNENGYPVEFQETGLPVSHVAAEFMVLNLTNQMKKTLEIANVLCTTRGERVISGDDMRQAITIMGIVGVIPPGHNPIR